MSWGIDSYDPDYYDDDEECFGDDDDCFFDEDCCQLNPFHSSDECCTAEMIEAEMAEFAAEMKQEGK